MESGFNISINLLPKLEAEIANKQKKFKKVQLLATLTVIGLFLIVSVTFSLAIIQNSRLKKAEANLNQVKSEVEQFKAKEVTLLILKDRVKEVDRLKDQPSKPALMFSLINKLFPSAIFPQNVNIEKNASANLVLTAQNIEEVDNLFNDLLDKEKNEDLVKKVNVDNLSSGRDGTYRVTLKLRND